jgi:hypothetical protein
MIIKSLLNEAPELVSLWNWLSKRGSNHGHNKQPQQASEADSDGEPGLHINSAKNTSLLLNSLELTNKQCRETAREHSRSRGSGKNLLARKKQTTNASTPTNGIGPIGTSPHSSRIE